MYGREQKLTHKWTTEQKRKRRSRNGRLAASNSHRRSTFIICGASNFVSAAERMRITWAFFFFFWLRRNDVTGNAAALILSDISLAAENFVAATMRLFELNFFGGRQFPRNRIRWWICCRWMTECIPPVATENPMNHHSPDYHMGESSGKPKIWKIAQLFHPRRNPLENIFTGLPLTVNKKGPGRFQIARLILGVFYRNKNCSIALWVLYRKSFKIISIGWSRRR